MKKSKIVRILAASALLTLSVTATSFAAKGDKEVDLSVGLATSTNSGFETGFDAGFDAGFGLSAGGGYELLDITAIKGSTLQVRGDIGYNHWSKSAPGGDITYARVPISAGARLYIPIEAVKKLRVYGEASLELSFDEIDLPSFNNGIVTIGGGSHSETYVGLTPGAGVEFVVAPNIFVGGGLKFHIIDGSYLNASVGVGYKF